MSSIIGLIPARSGSKRCPGKNTRLFFGHPLMAYTIAAAKESGIFDDIMVSTDSAETYNICREYGVGGIRRPDSISQDTSTDSEWIKNLYLKQDIV
jgi:N-acylneuraminate cytidylyltransferase